MIPNYSSDNTLPNWLAIPEFVAKTTTEEKTIRACHQSLALLSLYGLFAVSTRESGFLAYASYASMAYNIQKIAAVVLGYLVYPAALTSFPFCGRKSIKEEGAEQIANLRNESYVVKEFFIKKSGIAYSAILVTDQTRIKNGKWVICALGNGMDMETHVYRFAKEHFAYDCNTLLINGPSVVSSKGWPTPYQMGAGFEAGIQFLEQTIKATHIIMKGLSLGGAMMAKAIEQHDFNKGQKDGIQYLSITDRSFSDLAKTAGAIISQFSSPFMGWIVERIFYLANLNINAINAAQKLSQLDITHIIIQHVSPEAKGGDHIIPDKVSLAVALHENPTLEHKIFLESRSILHNKALPNGIQNLLNVQIENFLN